MAVSKGVPKQDAGIGYFAYRDDGCDVSPTCLQCPLPQCKYEAPALLTRSAHLIQRAINHRNPKLIP